MTAPATNQPCAVCHQRHFESSDGWYATNGHPRHPWTPPEQQAEQPKPFGPVLSYAWAKCAQCAAIIENNGPDLHRHHQWHEETGR